MNTQKPAPPLTLAVVTLLLGFAACAPQPEQPAAETMEAEDPLGQEVVALPDTTGASLWEHLQRTNYQETYTLWPGKGELYTGQEPHGMLLTTYVNDLALGAVNTMAGTMPEGAIVVKENYMPDSTLAAVTVMYKVSGYNPDHNDWFFTKHLPSGELDSGPDGMPLEGRVTGCQACHAAQKANDYLFTGAIR